VAAYIRIIYVLERRGLVLGAAAGGAERVSASRNIPLPPPRTWNPRDDTGHAHVTQSTSLGQAEALDAGGGGLHHHHIYIGAPWTCERISAGRDMLPPPPHAFTPY
jgi:hypothetical protein